MNGPRLFEVPPAPPTSYASPAKASAEAAAAYQLTHENLVLRACRWLRRSVRCKAVLAEPGYGRPREVPDAIGWTNTISVLVECKATRQDFLKDRRKPGRCDLPEGGGAGMGDERWYLTPPNLVRPDELPEAWGLLEVVGERVYRRVPAARRRPHPDSLRRERRLLASCLAAVQRRDEGLSLLPSRHLDSNLGTGPTGVGPRAPQKVRP